ncbi:MAG: hypothetical protein J3K34DRAFT_415223 [Monoraphidium minutum]|nr:MAG: hypothetical protein J3K34DRAFT_415223 [Monoraphidium minutum]
MAPAVAVHGEPLRAGQESPGCADVDVFIPEVGKVEYELGKAPTGDLHSDHAPAAPTRAAFAALGPVIATGLPKLQGSQVINGTHDTAAPIPLNEHVVDMETEAFKGKLLLSVRGTPGAGAAAGPGGPLACSRRTFHIAVQGTFKRPVAADTLVSGQEFPKPPKTSPSFMHFVFSTACKVFANTSDVFVQEGEPMHFKFPVLAAAQLLNVSRRGEEPPMLDAQEDVRLWCPELAARCGGPAAADKRRRFFDTPSNLVGRALGPEYVWTLHLHQSLIDFTTYKLGLSGVPFGIDLVSLLDAQPLQVMAKDEASGEYVFGLLMWNERLLGASDAAGATEEHGVSGRLKSRFRGLLSGW